MDFQFGTWWRDAFAVFALVALGLGIVAAVRCRRSQRRLNLLNTTSAEAGGGTTAFRSQVSRVVELSVFFIFALNLLWKHRSTASAAAILTPLGVSIVATSWLVLRDRLYWERWLSKYPATPTGKGSEQ